jgi:hypothetical protein
MDLFRLLRFSRYKHEAPDIPGAEAVQDLCGWCFHDAEVLEVHLDRAGASWIVVETAGKARVRFRFDKVTDIQLEGFNHQNVLGEADIRKTAPKESGTSDQGEVWRLTLYPCYGISGYIEAASMSATVEKDHRP